jgi:2-keto-3-deoxy-L-rhamnonate aldolase RhmA
VGRAIDSVVTKARAAKKFVGIGCGVEPAEIRDWANRGVQWMLMGADYQLLRKIAVETVAEVKAGLSG